MPDVNSATISRPPVDRSRKVIREVEAEVRSMALTVSLAHIPMVLSLSSYRIMTVNFSCRLVFAHTFFHRVGVRE
jgi:hypothetical protein